MHISTHAQIKINKHVRSHEPNMQTPAHLFACKHMHMYAHMPSMHVLTRMYMHICHSNLHKFANQYMHAHTHTQKHAQTLTHSPCMYFVNLLILNDLNT